jgi:uncharacterized protein (TIGR02147 family)
MNTELYTQKDYKQIVRLRLKERQKTNPSLTLKKLSDLIPVQYTYLSKVLNSNQSHLNEDHLFTISRVLGLQSEEADYLMTLRAWDVAQDPERKRFLHGKLENQRREQKLNIEQKDLQSDKLSTEMQFLLNPLCIVVHVAISNLILRKNPQALCSKLGISLQQLKEILRILALNDLVELDRDQITVKATKQMQFHLGRNHPLMRVHQNALKAATANRISQTEEDQKQCFMATFTSNEEDFEQIKSEFQVFLKKVEGVARRSQKPKDNDQVYHLNFDFFRWI